MAVKEHMDALAECRAGKNPGRKTDLGKRLADVLDAQHLDQGQRARWDPMAGHDTGTCDPVTRTVLGPDYVASLDGPQTLRDHLGAAGLTVTVDLGVDLGVVRSHTYCTGVSFEVDAASARAPFTRRSQAAGATTRQGLLLCVTSTLPATGGYRRGAGRCALLRMPQSACRPPERGRRWSDMS